MPYFIKQLYSIYIFTIQLFNNCYSNSIEFLTMIRIINISNKLLVTNVKKLLNNNYNYNNEHNIVNGVVYNEISR